MTETLRQNQQVFAVLPFATALDCIRHPGPKPDLVVYQSVGYRLSDQQELLALRQAFAFDRIVVLLDRSAPGSEAMRRIIAENGASGLVLASTSSLKMLLSAIHLMMAGGTIVSAEPGGGSLMPPRPEQCGSTGSRHRLTPREQAVLALLRHGKPNKIIASELGLSICTVKIHARNLMKKMGAANRTQAAVRAAHYPGAEETEASRRPRPCA